MSIDSKEPIEHVENVENVETPKERPPRNVFVSKEADVVTYNTDGTEARVEKVNRNIHELVAHISKMPPESIIGVYLVEDESKSEEPAEGEARYRMPLLPAVPDKDGNMQPSDKLPAVQALSLLMSAIVPDKAMLAQFHSMFDHASATTRLDCGMITLIFDGKPCGFAYVNSCRDVQVSSLSTLYETAMGQMDQLKDSLRQLAPGIRFSDDEEDEPDPSEKLVLPSGAPASMAGGPVLTPQEAAKQDMEANVTRIISLD